MAASRIFVYGVTGGTPYGRAENVKSPGRAQALRVEEATERR